MQIPTPDECWRQAKEIDWTASDPFEIGDVLDPLPLIATTADLSFDLDPIGDFLRPYVPARLGTGMVTWVSDEHLTVVPLARSDEVNRPDVIEAVRRLDESAEYVLFPHLPGASEEVLAMLCQPTLLAMKWLRQMAAHGASPNRLAALTWTASYGYLKPALRRLADP